jgi:hypothetical protein
MASITAGPVEVETTMALDSAIVVLTAYFSANDAYCVVAASVAIAAVVASRA